MATDSEPDRTAPTSVSKIVEDIRRRGTRGTTAEEASYRLNVGPSSYTGRRSELHRRGIIERLEEKRDGQAVYVMPDHIEGRTTRPYRPHRGPAGPEVEEAVHDVEHWMLIGDSHIPDSVLGALTALLDYVKKDI